MSDTAIEIRIKTLESAIESLKETSLDRKDYLLLLEKIETGNKATQALYSDVQDIKKDLDTFNSFVNRWKGASFILFTLGALASFVITQTINLGKFIFGGN